LKYQRFAPSGTKDIGKRRFEFVAKTQFLCVCFNFSNFNEKIISQLLLCPNILI